MKPTRRQIFSTLGYAAAGTLVPRSLSAQADEPGPNTLSGVWLEPFVDPLPIPRVLTPAAATADSQRYSLTLSEFPQKVHRDLPPTLMWGYEGSLPGPTITARRGCAVHIEWRNKLPLRHRLAVDHNLSGAGTDVPDVRTVVHLHGGHVASKDDGYPDDWITPGSVQKTVYPNQQPAATLFYHDHAMGITRLNNMMGLAGFYLIRDPEEDQLRLPSGAYDIPLAIQDRILDAQGQLVYPIGPAADAPWVPEFFGTHVLVNGRVWPFLNVEPRRYRFRFLNASNSRVYQLSLTPEQPFVQIGSDGGLLSQPVTRDHVLLAPAERADVIVDFSGYEGHRLTLLNHAPAPYPSGGGLSPRFIMQFRVRRPLIPEPDTSEILTKLADVPVLQESASVKTRRHQLLEYMTNDARLHRVLLNGKRFSDPVTEDPKNGTTEIWEFVNPTIDAHPIHLHAVHFQLLDRRRFDTRRYQRTSEVAFIRQAIPASPEERGWKDTILCPPGQVTRIIIPFQGTPGRFVWHCHMLEHEDNEMMRPYILRG
jgi:spore coat protein A